MKVNIKTTKKSQTQFYERNIPYKNNQIQCKYIDMLTQLKAIDC